SNRKTMVGGVVMGKRFLSNHAALLPAKAAIQYSRSVAWNNGVARNGMCSNRLAQALLHFAFRLQRSSRTVSATRSGSKPNFRCNSLSGAEAPNVFMPITRPDQPT